MKRILTLLLITSATAAFAQNAPSGSPRVQGVPAGYGDPVQVTIRAADGSTPSALSTATAGDVAHDAVDSGNPIKIGGQAVADATATGSPVASGDRVNFRGTLWGSQYVTTNYRAASQNDATSDGLNSYSIASDGTLTTRSVVRTEVFDGTTWNRQRGDTNGAVALPALSASMWSYSSGATGILSNTTTAVTVKAAAGASVRNYVRSCQISTTAFGASVPIVFRDGAGGTVLWAGNVPTAGWLTPVTISFDVPLRGTANTLLEVATPTANTTGTAFVNCQGYTGA